MLKSNQLIRCWSIRNAFIISQYNINSISWFINHEMIGIIMIVLEILIDVFSAFLHFWYEYVVRHNIIALRSFLLFHRFITSAQKKIIFWSFCMVMFYHNDAELLIIKKLGGFRFQSDSHLGGLQENNLIT